MTKEEVDRIWFEAMRQSAEAGEPYSRYHFAALVAKTEREACAHLVETFYSSNPNLLAAAIRARGET